MNQGILIVLLWILPFYANACSWVGDPTGGIPYEKRLNKYIKNAQVIFTGRIVSYEWKVNEAYESKSEWHHHKIEVIKIFKGKPPQFITYWPDTSCHEIFSVVGEEFLFFGKYNENNQIQFPMVSGTLPLAEANRIGAIKKLSKRK
jgi:hypothetical protein